MTMAPNPLLLTPSCVGIFARGELSSAQHRLFWMIAAQVGGGVEVISLTELAQRAELTRVTTIRAVHRLLRAGLLVRGARVGVSFQYKLNPAYVRVL